MSSFGLAAREGIVVRMRADAPLGALVPPGSMYGERVPDDRAYPFTRVGPPEAEPFRMSGYARGETARFNVSAFVRGVTMDDAAMVDAAIKAALDDATIDVAGSTAVVTWLGGRITPDRLEPDCWHVFNTFTVA